MHKLHIMGFGEDLRGELFGKLGVESETDPLKLIEQGIAEKSNGNNQGAKKAFEQANSLASAQAEKYISQNQHRAAAEALYVQALANEHLENSTEASQLYAKVVDSLLAAGKNAMAFGENNRGMASGALAGMVALMYDDQDKAFEIYNSYLAITEQKENSAFLQKLLYSLGYLLDALKNDNVAALTDAQNYMSTDLRPMLSTAKLTGFESLLDRVLRHTQDILQSRITMPKIMVGTSLPRDIQFNQLFDFDIEITNSGEGSATSMEIVLSIPEDIEVVDGKTNESVEKLDPNQDLKRKLQLRFLTGDTSGAQNREIKGNVNYFDMLGNSHKQYFGPIEIEFTAISKKEEYQDKLKLTLKPMEEVTPENLHGSVPPFVFELLNEEINGMKTSIEEAIQQEEFDQVEFGLARVEKSIERISRLTSENETTTKISSHIDNIVEKIKQEQKDELEQKFSEEKQEALDQLTTEKDEEFKEKIEQLKKNLHEEHQKEINKLKDDHQQVMQTMQREHEMKLNQSLSSLDTKLREEFRNEKNKLTEEHQSDTDKLRENNKQEVESLRQEIRSELTNKYEEKIKELESNIDEMRTQLQSEHEKELQEQKQEYEGKLSEKDQEISTLRENSTSSNNG